jgi:6-phosphofructokinase 1
MIMTMTKRVAILTGGGDVPGLNMCLKGLVYQSIDLGFEPIGVRKGWEGLINYNPQDPSTYSDHFIELTKNMVRPIDRTPGSFLHSSRLEPREVPSDTVPEFLRDSKTDTQDLTEHIIDVVQRLDYRTIIVVGDDDTLHYAAHLSQLGVPIIGIPKTIHNNILGTDYTLGFSTGLARGVAFIHELRALAGSREQIIVIETFAAESGYSALLMAWLAGADRVIIPEVPYDPEILAFLTLQDKRQTPANYAVAVVCDGSTIIEEKKEQYKYLLNANRNQAGSGMDAAKLLGHITGEEVFLQTLTYLLRTGPPDGQDLLGAANFALSAAKLLKEARFGRMTAFIQNEMWTDVDLGLAKEGVKRVNIDALYYEEEYKPKLSLIWSAENG